jgi:heme oxygenase
MSLRVATASAHREVEQIGALPERIASVADYAGCLQRYLSVLAPVERELAGFAEFHAQGIDIGPRLRGGAIMQDLRRLGVAVPADAPQSGPALLGGFGEALGALYVTEGASLGGQVIIRAVKARLGAAVSGATAFFEGHGAENGRMWAALRADLDRIGAANPAVLDAAARGALLMFGRFGEALRGNFA